MDKYEELSFFFILVSMCKSVLLACLSVHHVLAVSVEVRVKGRIKVIYACELLWATPNGILILRKSSQCSKLQSNLSSLNSWSLVITSRKQNNFMENMGLSVPLRYFVFPIYLITSVFYFSGLCLMEFH